MPRKKQGLRNFHHKSKNGCTQCKRRRVKCNMQTPACGNCVRRNEHCEYPTFNESTDPPAQSQWLADLPSVGSSSALSVRTSSSDLVPSSSVLSAPSSLWTPLHAGPASGTIESDISSGSIGSLVSTLFSYSWFPPQEQALWVPALTKAANEHPYLQHGVHALLCLVRNRDAPFHSELSVAAYRHQVTASNLFRQSLPVVTEDSWIAVLAFSVFMLIFQFCSQNAVEASHFDLIETLQVVRFTMDVETEAKQYFQRSPIYALILERTRLHIPEPDEGLRRSLQLLSNVVAAAMQNENNDDDDEERAEINRQAFFELREWAIICDGYPRRWNHYCHWPGRVTSEFFDLLADGDDIALLILIHWTAIMHRSFKTFIKSWTRRAAFFAIDNLEGDWGELLAWPVEILSPSSPAGTAPPTVPMHLQLSSTVSDPHDYSTYTNYSTDSINPELPPSGSGMGPEHIPTSSAVTDREGLVDSSFNTTMEDMHFGFSPYVPTTSE